MQSDRGFRISLYLCIRKAAKQQHRCNMQFKNNIDMSIDTYKLTSTEEPTDEVLSQLMREAAEEARETNAQATQRYFDELRQAAANIR